MSASLRGSRSHASRAVQEIGRKLTAPATPAANAGRSTRIEGNTIAEILRVPTLESLQSALTEILGALQPQVLDRKTSVHSSSHPSEVVTCELADGSSSKLLIKYSGFDERESFGHRGGVAYEAMVYRDVLSRVALPSARWYGNYYESASGRTWVILQFMETVQHIGKSRLPLSSAANWIGRFHRATRSFVPPPALKHYDAVYYAGWARRTRALALQFGADYPWLPVLCDTFEELSAELADWQPTIIHGEYYTSNILVSNGVVCPVDWESAAFAQGEVDIASLTDLWPLSVARECEAAYVESRWPQGEPLQLPRMLGLARLYIHFRWLARPHMWTRSRAAGRVNRLKDDAGRLGLL